MPVLPGQRLPTTHEKLAESTDTQDDPDVLLARLAVHYKMLTRDSVENALDRWQTLADGENFGSFLLAENYLGENKLDQLVQARDKYLQQQGVTRETTAVTSVAPLISSPQAVLAGQPIPESAVPKTVEPHDRHTNLSMSVAKPVISLVESSTAPAPQIKQADKSDLLHYGPGVTLRHLLQQTIELDASDLHVHSGAFLQVRLNGEICKAS